ncbi:TetR/AcrR family transcriptional regulator [Ideonella azotifigens]|uniref:HTH tetR-type domain-containing protein n=1 Tax=Ideonella azotifigens TaxID=513160 RepID=A0ABN1K513_9BURK|nr:TetR/AcrR family transcriptional regulator [Ideonella azotifigens]MCD2344431.1 TetR/AcrR family transcriptional regulator [Ideonella azotifigens]
MINRTAFPIRRHKQARPQELLDAALSLFIEKGFAAARIDEIAARAGVCKGTLYLYFDSKEDLLKALIAQRFSSRVAISLHETTDVRASPDMLRELIATWQSEFVAGEAGGIVNLLFTEARNFPVLANFWMREVITPTRLLVSRIVKHGIERAEFRAVDPDIVVDALVLPLIAACLHRHAIAPYSTLDAVPCGHADFNGYFEFVLEGLMDRPADSSQSPNRITA